MLDVVVVSFYAIRLSHDSVVYEMLVDVSCETKVAVVVALQRQTTKSATIATERATTEEQLTTPVL